MSTKHFLRRDDEIFEGCESVVRERRIRAKVDLLFLNVAREIVIDLTRSSGIEKLSMEIIVVFIVRSSRVLSIIFLFLEK